MVEVGWPIVPQYREDGELVRILLHEDWYDRLLPVYKYFLWVTGSLSVTPPANSTLNKVGEIIESLVFKFELLGWVFSLSVLYFHYEAAKKVVTIGKFVYERAGWGEAEWGKGPWGKSQTIIKEFPE